MTGNEPRIEYVEARRVLLDALTALQPHIGAIVLIGAQAIYLRTAGRLSTYQPFTTDADLALDPALLADERSSSATGAALGFVRQLFTTPRSPGIDLAVEALARELLKEAVSADVGYGPAHNNLGKVYFEQGNYYEAAWEFEYASKLMPRHPEPRNNLGLVLEKVNRYGESVEAYEAALEMTPDHPEIIGNLARTRLRRRDDLDELRPLFEKLLLTDTSGRWADWSRRQMPSSRDEGAAGK